MVNGTIIDKGFNTARGNYVIMKDSTSGLAFLYQHMREETPLNVGDTVEIGMYVGDEGETGEVTGIHLHLEEQDLSSGRNWNFTQDLQYYENPAEFMGIPNQEGISVFYNGTPKPIPQQLKKHMFNWKVFTRLIRNRRNNDYFRKY